MDPRPPHALRLAKLLRHFNRIAAEHAADLQDLGKPADAKFCSLPRFRISGTHELDEGRSFRLRADCCDEARFDFLGNEACFPEWPSWLLRVCCAYAASTREAPGFRALWRQVTEETPMNVPEGSSNVNAVVVYHKALRGLNPVALESFWGSSFSCQGS